MMVAPALRTSDREDLFDMHLDYQVVFVTNSIADIRLFIHVNISGAGQVNISRHDSLHDLNHRYKHAVVDKTCTIVHLSCTCMSWCHHWCRSLNNPAGIFNTSSVDQLRTSSGSGIGISRSFFNGRTPSICCDVSADIGL